MDTYICVVCGLNVDLRMKTKIHVFKRDKAMCLKYANHTKLNSQHGFYYIYIYILGGGVVIWPLNEHINLQVYNELDIHTSSKNYE